MKNILHCAAALAVLFLFACKNETPSASQAAAVATEAPATATNPDVDEHGCRTNAGMTWSEVRKECIALFQGGVRMVPIDSFMDKTMAAFIVQKGDFDDSQVELFIPKQKGTSILDKQADGNWKNQDYTVTKSGKDYTILDGKDNHVLYKGTVGR